MTHRSTRRVAKPVCMFRASSRRTLADGLSTRIDNVSSSISTVRVRYAETDQMGIVYYANYLVWMEVARVDFCKAIGFHYKNMEIEDGILLAVAESHCRYLSPARFDDHVQIATTVTEKNRRMVTFSYEMTCDNRRLATGWTKHIFLDKSLRPVSLPRKYMDLFGM
jgi:acyl-CoA thioester hydrolase